MGKQVLMTNEMFNLNLYEISAKKYIIKKKQKHGLLDYIKMSNDFAKSKL